MTNLIHAILPRPTCLPIAAASPDAIEALIERCLQGDQLAWEQIVRQHWRKVFNVAYKFVGKHDEAEDLTQDIFLKIFKSLDTFDRRANFQTWLISVSRNLCIDHYRSVRKERETIDRDVDANELSPVVARPGPGRRARAARPRRAAAQALAALPETLRTAVLLRDIQELSYQEIADRLRLPEGTVKSRINRGRTELARQIRKLRGDDSARAVRRRQPAHGSVLMNLTTEQTGGVAIVRVGETRLMYPILVRLLGRGQRPHRRRRAARSSSTCAGHLRGQRDDRLPDGPLPPGQRRRRRAEAVRRPEARRDDADDDRRAELHRDPRRRAERRQELRGLAMRTIKTTTGADDRARRRPARRHGSALPGGDRQARARAVVRGHGAGDPPPHRPDGRRASGAPTCSRACSSTP